MTAIDGCVVIGYLLIVALIGLRAARQSDQADDLYLAKRSIPAWAAAFSVVATVLSGATFLGMP